MKIKFMSKLFHRDTEIRNDIVESKAPINLNSIIDLTEGEKSFKDVITEWLCFHRAEIEESTYYGYKMLCSLLKEYFGDILITEITTYDINLFIMKMKSEGVTKASIYNRCRVLKLCFDYACTNGYIKENPVNMAYIPKLPKHTEVYPFSFQEVMQLLKQDYLQWVKDGIVIALHTGMRKGEIYALKWTDIDFDQKFIMVQCS